jgi:Fe-S-cluster containining protein
MSVKRADLERALRHLNMSDVDLRDAVIDVAARVIALTEELDRRGDGTLEAAVEAALPQTLVRIRANDMRQMARVELDPGPDKYDAQPAAVPCEELLAICEARCCKLQFALSTQDLDEGVLRWDYGRPYRIRQRASDGYCTHNDPASHGCTVHGQRPRVCRTYDCRKDPRIWADFENRVLAPPGVRREPPEELDLFARARTRAAALAMEDIAVRTKLPSDD